MHGGEAESLSCLHTPYPHVCNHYMSTNTLSTSSSSSSSFSFHEMALQVTMDQAIEAHKLVSTMRIMDNNDFNGGDNRAKLAWSDCLELYEDTVFQLNRSVSKSKNPDDRLTWLSAATANHQTCQNGFLDLNLQSHLNYFPNMLGNFSKLLSNSLAITKAMSISSSSFKRVNNNNNNGGGRKLLGSYPEWVLESDRKLIEAAPGTPGPDVVVAKDGSGNYKSIAEGVAAAAKMGGGGGRRVVVHVKGGVYAENVEIKRTMKNLMIVGDGIGVTIVTGSKSAAQTTTFSSATFAVSGDNFIARDITFENTAGPAKHQAVALRCGADHAVFHRCSFLGYQDTLYVYSQRQFYRDCDIHGTVDFIFGDAAAILQNCNINARKPMGGQQNSVTAHGRSDPNENTGIIIQNCRVTGAPGTNNFLGRPWREYARTVVMASELGGIHPAGWLEWSGSFALKTLYYAEYMNTGGGAATGGRVKWPGFHVLRSPAEVSEFSVGNFLGGESWIPGANVPFNAGL
ncbi:putative pectinesterase/pectinesterase inhibitor 6 [Senna tora]|uniref:Pectinesterase n=1 Tax=Senna tora TaxID=362788 RepID=A0A834SRM5_9FABA|nr:putative pectinesterase/pectinesterase inhibitor 6 [Senna tora]